MTQGSWAESSKLNLLPFYKTDHAVVLKLMTKPITHLSREKRIVLETFEQVIAGVALGNEVSNTSGNLT